MKTFGPCKRPNLEWTLLWYKGPGSELSEAMIRTVPRICLSHVSTFSIVPCRSRFRRFEFGPCSILYSKAPHACRTERQNDDYSIRATQAAVSMRSLDDHLDPSVTLRPHDSFSRVQLAFTRLGTRSSIIYRPMDH